MLEITKTTKRESSRARLIGATCLLVLCVILTAGLWPFHAPKNDVTWLAGQNGVRFGGHGTLISAGEFGSGGSAGSSSGSVEMWLESELVGKSKTILSFASSKHPGEPFSISQNKDALQVRRYNIDRTGIVRTAICEIAGVFRRNKRVFATVTLAERQTAISVDGIPARTCAIAGSTDNLSGTIVVANSTTASSSWPGKLLGLAIYPQPLTATDTAKHYEAWTTSGHPALSQTDAPAALYLFDEGGGSIIHNRVSTTIALMIPPRYLILHPAFLSPPWLEYRPRWSYWVDVGINVAGFVPLGLCFAVYFYSVRQIIRPAAQVVLLGFCVSSFIEVLQFFLPTRSSGTTDLITNTLGTAIGLVLYRVHFLQNLWLRIGWSTSETYAPARVSNEVDMTVSAG